MKSAEEWMNQYVAGGWGSLKNFWIGIQQDACADGVAEGLDRAVKIIGAHSDARLWNSKIEKNVIEEVCALIEAEKGGGDEANSP